MDLSPARHRPPIARLSSGKLQQLAAHQLRQHYAAAAAQQQQQARLASHHGTGAAACELGGWPGHSACCCANTHSLPITAQVF